MLNIYTQKDCSICFNTLQNDTTCITNCNHEFCIDCIDKWVNKNKTYCPLCRQQLKEYYCNNHKTKIIVIEQENIINEEENIINEQQNIVNNIYFIREAKLLFILLVILIYYFFSNYRYTTLYYNATNLNNKLINENNELQIKYNDCIN